MEGCAHLGRALGLGLSDLAGPLVEGILGTLGHVDAGDVLLLGDALETSGVPGVVATHPGADHGRAADGDAARVEKKMPRRVKRKRAIFADDGAPAGQEEYYDYIFPEEQGAAPNLKILEAAYAWKKRRTE